MKEQNEKKQFTAPAVEHIEFEENNVIETSGETGGNGGGRFGDGRFGDGRFGGGGNGRFH